MVVLILQGLAEGESALDKFTSDLTHSARMGKLDPVIGEPLCVTCYLWISPHELLSPCLYLHLGRWVM